MPPPQQTTNRIHYDSPAGPSLDASWTRFGSETRVVVSPHGVTILPYIDDVSHANATCHPLSCIRHDRQLIGRHMVIYEPLAVNRISSRCNHALPVLRAARGAVTLVATPGDVTNRHAFHSTPFLIGLLHGNCLRIECQKNLTNTTAAPKMPTRTPRLKTVPPGDIQYGDLCTAPAPISGVGHELHI